MRWPLFTWMLAGGIFGMFWFVYLSIKQNEKHWKPVAQYLGRHRRQTSWHSCAVQDDFRFL